MAIATNTSSLEYLPATRCKARNLNERPNARWRSIADGPRTAKPTPIMGPAARRCDVGRWPALSSGSIVARMAKCILYVYPARGAQLEAANSAQPVLARGHLGYPDLFAESRQSQAPLVKGAQIVCPLETALNPDAAVAALSRRRLTHPSRAAGSCSGPVSAIPQRRQASTLHARRL